MGIQTLAKPTPMLDNAKARPRQRVNHWAMTTLTTMELINASPKVTTVKPNRRELREAFHLAENEITHPDDGRAHGHQPAAAVAID